MLIRKIDPKGVDLVIDRLQDYIFANYLATEYQSYPRAYKNNRGDGGIIPEIYVGENEYIESFFDDRFEISSFWLVDDNSDVDEFTSTTVSVIFQVLLDELYPSITHRADEEFIRDMYNILYENPWNYKISDVVRGIDNVYSEFDTSQVQWDDMSNFFVCRFDLEVDYAYSCDTINVGNSCAPAVYQNSDGSFVQTINSGVTYVSPNIDLTLNGGVFLSLPSNKDQDILLKNQDGIDVIPESITGNEVVVNTSGVCADASVSNSDDSYNATVASGGALELPDINVTINGSNQGDFPSVQDLTLNYNCPPSECNSLNLLKTGQVISYAPNDDGAIQEGRDTDFHTLSWTNPAGNNSRFTDDFGGQTYTNMVYVDWTTYDQANDRVMGVCFSSQQGLPSVDWDTWIAGQPYTLHGYSDWFVGNVRQATHLIDFSNDRYYNYPPLNYSVVSGTTVLWTSTTRDGLSTSAWTVNTGALIRTNGKTIAYGTMFVRFYTLAELGL